MRSAILAVVLLAVAPPARAADESALFYADFQRFCAATNADPDAVKKAVEADGAVAAGSQGKTDAPMPMTAQLWHRTVGGRTLTVSAGVQRLRATPDRPAMTTLNCAVSSNANEDAAIAAIRKWAGVPDGFPERPDISFYDFRIVGGRHVAVSPRGAASTFREHWTLMIVRDATSASVHFTHVMPAGD